MMTEYAQFSILNISIYKALTCRRLNMSKTKDYLDSYRQIKGDAQLLFDKKNNTVWIMW